MNTRTWLEQIHPGARDQSDGTMESVGTLNLGCIKGSISMAGMGVRENRIKCRRGEIRDEKRHFIGGKPTQKVYTPYISI